jgi:hypothetical protein
MKCDLGIRFFSPQRRKDARKAQRNIWIVVLYLAHSYPPLGRIQVVDTVRQKIDPSQG